eukprot:384990-Pelagomonas_calceolata.AAC.1
MYVCTGECPGCHHGRVDEGMERSIPAGAGTASSQHHRALFREPGWWHAAQLGSPKMNLDTAALSRTSEQLGHIVERAQSSVVLPYALSLKEVSFRC